MQDISNSNSFATIHFPQRKNLIKRLRIASFYINDLILVVSAFILVVWIINVPVVTVFLFQKLSLSPFLTILFMLSGISLFFGAKRHLVSMKEMAEERYPWWNTWIPIFLASIVTLLGVVSIVSHAPLESFFHAPIFSGFCFLLIGLALIPPFTRIPHRFHITQICIFIVGGLNAFIILENLYQLFSPLPVQHIIFIPLPSAFVFTIFCFGVLLRWSNRGFIGNFTLDATGSVFAFRLFLLNLFLTPILAFLILLLTQKTSLNMFQVLTIVVICFTLVSSSLLWVNVKLLYTYELEHLLMREALRTHNIDLTMEKEVLQKRMIQLEQDKKQYVDKLNTQNVLRETVEATE